MTGQAAFGALLFRIASAPFDRPGLTLVVSLGVAAVSIVVLMAG